MTELKRTEGNLEPTSIGAVVTDAKDRISQVLGQATGDIVTLVLQEAGRIAAQYKPELLAVGKGLGALGIAALGGILLVFFMSLALVALLATVMPLYLAAGIVAALWAAIAGLALWFLRREVQQVLSRHKVGPRAD